MCTRFAYSETAYSDPVKRWNLHKDDWKHFCFLTKTSVDRLPYLDTTNIEKAYQELCEILLFVAEQCIPLSRRKNLSLAVARIKCHVGTKSARPFIAPSSKPQWGLTLTEPPRCYFHDSTIRSRSDRKKLSIPSTSCTPAGRREAPSTNFKKKTSTCIVIFK